VGWNCSCRESKRQTRKILYRYLLRRNIGLRPCPSLESELCGFHVVDIRRIALQLVILRFIVTKNRPLDREVQWYLDMFVDDSDGRLAAARCRRANEGFGHGDLGGAE
jgi:hypothetical protein